MPSDFSVGMLAAGLVLIAIGYLLRRWANRHSLIDQTTDAVWDAVKARDTDSVRRHVKGTIGEIANQAGAAGKARRAAGMAITEAAARAAGFVGALALAAGLVLAVLAFVWT